MKKDYADDKDAVAGITAVEKELATAFEHHTMLCAGCEKTSFDALHVMSCCDDLTKHLDKALAEHSALMRKLARKPAPPAAK